MAEIGELAVLNSIHMKIPYPFTRSTILASPLRLAIASALVIASAGMAFMASKTSNPAAPVAPAFAFKKGDPDLMGAGDNKRAIIGPNEYRAGDYTPDVEAYLVRAYPASTVPTGASSSARKGWSAMDGGSHFGGAWQLIGPSTANFPGVLTFSGHDYTTSGRITALAISPNCDRDNCTLYVGAAGGGIWRTNNALATTPTWQFLSTSFGTNAIGSLLIAPNDR
ncbi:MAG TPA: hypothetical protein VGI42_07730, partial [Chthoniobacterales bacterium]